MKLDIKHAAAPVPKPSVTPTRRTPMGNPKVVTTVVPDAMYTWLEVAIRDKKFRNRSEAIRQYIDRFGARNVDAVARHVMVDTSTATGRHVTVKIDRDGARWQVLQQVQAVRACAILEALAVILEKEVPYAR